MACCNPGFRRRGERLERALALRFERGTIQRNLREPDQRSKLRDLAWTLAVAIEHHGQLCPDLGERGAKVLARSPADRAR